MEGYFFYLTPPSYRSLREQNIQTACKECPADDEELTKRMELTKGDYITITCFPCGQAGHYLLTESKPIA